MQMRLFIVKLLGALALAKIIIISPYAASAKYVSSFELLTKASGDSSVFIAQTLFYKRKELKESISEGNRLFEEGNLSALKKAEEYFKKAVQLSEAANQKDDQAFSLEDV